MKSTLKHTPSPKHNNKTKKKISINEKRNDVRTISPRKPKSTAEIIEEKRSKQQLLAELRWDPEYLENQKHKRESIKSAEKYRKDMVRRLEGFRQTLDKIKKRRYSPPNVALSNAVRPAAHTFVPHNATRK